VVSEASAKVFFNFEPAVTCDFGRDSERLLICNPIAIYKFRLNSKPPKRIIEGMLGANYDYNSAMPNTVLVRIL